MRTKRKKKLTISHSEKKKQNHQTNSNSIVHHIVDGEIILIHHRQKYKYTMIRAWYSRVEYKNNIYISTSFYFILIKQDFAFTLPTSKKCGTTERTHEKKKN